MSQALGIYSVKEFNFSLQLRNISPIRKRKIEQNVKKREEKEDFSKFRLATSAGTIEPVKDYLHSYADEELQRLREKIREIEIKTQVSLGKLEEKLERNEKLSEWVLRKKKSEFESVLCDLSKSKACCGGKCPLW